jgi:hypothetical protein
MAASLYIPYRFSTRSRQFIHPEDEGNLQLLPVQKP